MGQSIKLNSEETVALYWIEIGKSSRETVCCARLVANRLRLALCLPCIGEVIL